MKIMNWKYQVLGGIINLNYLMDDNLYQILQIILSVSLFVSNEITFLFFCTLKTIPFEIIQTFFCLNWQLFLLVTDLETKWSQNEKSTFKKVHTSFFGFNFWYFELMLIDAVLNSASRNSIDLFQKCGYSAKKVAKLKILVIILLKCSLSVTLSCLIIRGGSFFGNFYLYTI